MKKFFLYAVLLCVGGVSACSKVESSSSSLNGEPWPQVVKDTSNEWTARVRPVIGVRGMVVADDPEAAAFGADILRRGGNAVDAAVATAFMMSVTRPHYASLGGGGFLLFCKKGSDCHVLDYRETAPQKLTLDLLKDENGKVNVKRVQDGALAVGTPGVVAGLLHALKTWGSFSRANVLAPTVQKALGGIRVDGFLESILKMRWEALNAEAKRLFSCGREAGTCEVGDTLKQPDLARVLQAVLDSGSAGFYRGWVASSLVEGLKSEGGVLSTRDLIRYTPEVRKPLYGHFKKWEIVTMPPPSAGGTNLIQMLAYAERAAQRGEFSEGPGSSRTYHALAHAMTLAYADRAEHFGDPKFVKDPSAALIQPEYLKKRFDSTFIFGKKAEIQAGELRGLSRERPETTHLVVSDTEGNMVSLTTTVNGYLGSGFVAPGTGVVLNNEMDDFSLQPGLPNGFGLVGSHANTLQPLKRPLSSMSPTIVRDEKGAPRIAIGAAGGPRIPTSVFQVLINRLGFGMPLSDAMAAPRIHEQWKPDVLYYEQGGLPREVTLRLSNFGWKLESTRNVATSHALERHIEKGRVWGVADPRGTGGAASD